ncbi:MAG: glycosyltransferase family 2 protein [Synergistaceae bacterium]|nr:glycosyltransferase family 2 protein [Synergistaceae bacterium]
MEQPRVDCVVVTYNRKALLLECLEAIYAQTFPVSSIILINNASTDDTEEALREAGYFSRDNFDYHLMPKNLGGAGGFAEGIKISRDNDTADWCWIMDDDSIPSPDALEKLIAATKLKGDEVSFFASEVYGVENETLNVPVLDMREDDKGYVKDWYRDLRKGIIKIQYATFVSIMINSKAIKKCGVPCTEYFIWGDDYEYTARLVKYYGDAYFVGGSVVLHKIAKGRASIYLERDTFRIKNLYYHYRNGVMNTLMYDSTKRAIYISLRAFYHAARVLVHPYRFRKILYILSGTFSGWINCGKFKKLIQAQIKQ